MSDKVNKALNEAFAAIRGLDLGPLRPDVEEIVSSMGEIASERDALRAEVERLKAERDKVRDAVVATGWIVGDDFDVAELITTAAHEIKVLYKAHSGRLCEVDELKQGRDKTEAALRGLHDTLTEFAHNPYVTEERSNGFLRARQLVERMILDDLGLGAIWREPAAPQDGK